MSIKKFFFDFSITFFIALVITALVTFFWNLLEYGRNAIDWETAISLAVTVGFVYAWLKRRLPKK